MRQHRALKFTNSLRQVSIWLVKTSPEHMSTFSCLYAKAFYWKNSVRDTQASILPLFPFFFFPLFLHFLCFHPLHLVCFIHPLSPPLRLIRFSSLCDIFFKAVSGFQLSSLMQEHHRYFSVKSTSGTMQEISLRLMVEGSKCLGTNSEMWVILKSRVRGQKS